MLCIRTSSWLVTCLSAEVGWCSLCIGAGCEARLGSKGLASAAATRHPGGSPRGRGTIRDSVGFDRDLCDVSFNFPIIINEKSEVSKHIP